jgi:ectoine hydroxylase-related dioxygenase (phytanoyl-CoA dioxygenase family)
MVSRDVDGDLATFERDGFVVAERAVGADTLGRIRDELAPWLGEGAHRGRNDFEGFATNRVYALLAKAPAIAELVEHPWVLAMLDRLLLPNPLLSANLAINLLPGETAQALHIDEDFYRLPRPRPLLAVSAIWAIDAFTADNGATEVIPGSHRWTEPPAGTDDHPDLQPVVMPAGSVVLFAGTLVHRGGANTTDRPRLAITPQYCQPWVRQQEQMILSVGARAKDYSARIQSLLGYSIHPPFMGHIDGLHPRRLLDETYDPASNGAGAASSTYWDAGTARPGIG